MPIIYCPCQSNKLHKDCCQPYLQGLQLPPSPEALMRSRYCAFFYDDLSYIEKTMRGQALQQAQSSTKSAKLAWCGLQIMNVSDYKDKNKIAMVEFKAFYRMKQKKFYLHEISDFQWIDHQWFYIDGRII